MDKMDLLEPAKLYKARLKDEHHELVEKTFDELTKKANVDVEGNAITCRELHKNESLLAKARQKLGNLSGLKFLFITMIVLGAISLFAGIMEATKSNEYAWIFIVVGALLIPGGITLLATVYKNKKAELTKKVSALEEKVNKLLAEAEAQMAQLNSLFESSLSARLFQKTCPLIEMDRIFDTKKYEMLREKYDMWGNDDPNVSTLDIQSGSILGNPFVFFKELNMAMVNKTYTGTLTISYSVGSGQNRHTVTETLRATYEAPAPVYSKNTYLVYGNEAANRLSFSRSPSNITGMDEKEIHNYVRKHEKELDKLAAKQMKKGGNYTPIGNNEFELFFGGLDRDNEVEFRLLFTALGQKSMMDLLKSKEGYGDDFSFRKIKGLNIITSAHSQRLSFLPNVEAFKGHEYETMKDFFVEFNDEYFKSVFFDLAPLLAIPLYQQNKTHEYIYKNTVKSNFNPFVHEAVANRFKTSELAHKLSKTDAILKTKFEKKTGETDLVQVTAHSFDAIPRVEIVQVWGGDGRMHGVSVPWTEYIPLINQSEIEINDIGVDDQVKFNSLGNNGIIYANGLVSQFGGSANVDIKKLKALMKKD